MKGKKVLEFLILKPAFTSRNLSSIGLVALFFLVYWLAGGKVAVPNVKQGSNFGSVTAADKSNPTATSSVVNGIRKNPSVLPPTNFPATEAGVNPDPKTEQLEEKLQKLNELEERLKSLKRAKSGGD